MRLAYVSFVGLVLSLGTTGCGLILGIEELSGEGGEGGGGGSTGTTGTTGGSTTGGCNPCTPGPIVVGQAAPHVVAVDGTFVYWGNSGDGAIRRARLDGSETTTIASNQNGIQGIATNGKVVAWTNESNVTMANVDGSNQKVISSSEAQPRAIAVDDTDVYWVNVAGNLANGGEVKSAKHFGTPEAPKASSQAQPWAIALSPTEVFWTNSNGSQPGFGSVMRVPKNGGGASSIVTGLTYPESIVLGQDVAWASRGNGTDGMIQALSNNLDVVPLATGLTTPIEMAAIVEEGLIYFLSLDGSIRSVPMTGGAPEFVATTNVPWGLAADATGVYWTTSDSIVRLPR